MMNMFSDDYQPADPDQFGKIEGNRELIQPRLEWLCLSAHQVSRLVGVIGSLNEPIVGSLWSRMTI
ncbi:hypothetical protein DN600_14385 [Aeromonas caviae]|nr:hypothetical protein DN600_14385 [Aeromonas caviae]